MVDALDGADTAYVGGKSRAFCALRRMYVASMAASGSEYRD